MRMGSTERSFIGNISQNSWNYGGITWSNTDGANWEYRRNWQSEGSGVNTFNGLTIDPGGKVIIGDIQNENYPTSPEDYKFSYNDATPAMSIAEVIVFEGRLNLPATRLMRTYLWLKYGINGAGDAWDKFHGNMERSKCGIITKCRPVLSVIIAVLKSLPFGFAGSES